MNTEKAKKAITLAIDVLGGRGRFTIREVADEAMRLVKYESLSINDQHEAVQALLSKEARHQLTSPLSDGMREAALRDMPDDLWPIFERLSQSITVGAGGERVLSLVATLSDFEDALKRMDDLRAVVDAGRASIRDALGILKTNGASTLHELINRKKSA